MGLIGKLIDKLLGCDDCQKCRPSISGADLMNDAYSDEEEDILSCFRTNDPCVQKVEDLSDPTKNNLFCQCVNAANQNDLQNLYDNNVDFKNLIDDYFALNPGSTLCGHAINYFQ